MTSVTVQALVDSEGSGGETSSISHTSALADRAEHSPTPTHHREHPRCRVELDVSLGSDHNFYAGFVENLSVGGVFVATHVLKAIGEVVEITVHLPGGSMSVQGVGEVRWLREFSDHSNVPPGMGIRFRELAPGGSQAIESFLASRDPLFFDDD